MKARPGTVNEIAGAQTHRISAAEEATQRPKTVQDGPGAGKQFIYDHQVSNPFRTSVDSGVTTRSSDCLREKTVVCCRGGLCRHGKPSGHRTSEETPHKT